MTRSFGDVIAVPSFAGSAAMVQRDISPPVGIRNRNWGLAATDTSEGIHRRLKMTVMALSNTSSRPLVLMCLDASWWGHGADEWQLRSAVLDALGLETDQLLISLSHTHSGVALRSAEADLDGGHLIAAYLDMLSETAVSAGREALATLEPAIVQWTAGHCTVAANRELNVQGRMLVGFNPDKAADDTVVIAKVTKTDGQTIGTLVNYACHPTTLAWQNRDVSPDYVGAMRDLVEAETGAPCAFVQGASGDLAPRHQYVGDVAVADRHGLALGHSVLAALNTLPPAGTALVLTGAAESGAPLAIWEPQQYQANETLRSIEEPVQLQPQPKPSDEELRARWSDIDEQSLNERLRRAQYSRQGFDPTKPISHPVWTWQIGDAFLVAQPGEAYSVLQQNLRAEHCDHPVVVMNLTNGPGSHYLASEDVYANNGYASWASKVAAGSLERLEQHASALIDRFIGDAH